MTVTVYTYGIHYRWLRDMPGPLRAELRMAHDLREDLVRIEADYEQAKRDVWSSYPAVASAESDLAVAEQAAEEAAAKVSVLRQEQRRRRVTGPAADALRAAREGVRAARQARRDAITVARADAKPRLDAAAAARTAAQKALYRVYVDRGLYWATHNDVVAHHRMATQRVAQLRASGRAATMRHHYHDGSGSIAVQLQRQAAMPARTPATIADPDGKWRNVLHMPWIDPDRWEATGRGARRAAGRISVRMRCGAGHVDVPVQAHRMLPRDADITGARLTVRRVASGFRGHITVTARVADPCPVTDGPTVALHLGWLDDAEGTRVATWRADAPLDIPADMRHVLAPDPGARTGVVVMPGRVSDRLASIDRVRAGRDEALNEARAALVAWLRAHGPVDHPTRDGEQVTAAGVALWRSPARFAVLAQAWRDDSPAAGGEVAAALEAWRRQDMAAWEGAEHGRRKVLGHRDDLYANVAAVIASQAGRLVVDETSVADIARSESDLPAEVAQRIAHRRTVATPGKLREKAASACEREGVPVVQVAARGLTRVHHGCGHENPADDRYMSRPVLCDGCGGHYDPDANATLLMLDRAVGSGGASAGTAREVS